MWKVTVKYDYGNDHVEILKDDVAMLEFARNLETDSVVEVIYSRYV